jgi:hypothetical protein
MLAEYELYPPQMRALVSPATELLYGGAVGGGKSYLARVGSIVYSLEIPGLITYLFRRTFKEVVANHIYTPGGYLEMLAPMIKAKEVIFSKNEYSFAFRNGSRIQLAHSQYEGDIYSHQGAQIGFLIIDEATHFTEEMIRFIRSRVRLGSLSIPGKYKGLFPRILYTANPGGPSHHFFKSNFVNFGGGHVYRAPEDEGGMLREYIPSYLRDNKALLHSDPEYATRLLGLGDTALVKGMLEGDWDALSSGGFTDVWDSRRHVLAPFAIPGSWRIDKSYDYGSTSPAACVWFAESNGEEVGDGRVYPRGTIFIIGEVYIANRRNEGLRLTATEQASKILDYENGELRGIIGSNYINVGPADSAIFVNEPGHTSVAMEMERVGVKFCRAIKSAGSRVQGVQIMRQRLLASKVGSIEQAGIYIFSNCVHTIRTVPELQSDSTNEDDVDTHGEDHIWDCIRYRILRAARVVHKARVTGI